jgi:hypothetical protein
MGLWLVAGLLATAVSTLLSPSQVHGMSAPSTWIETLIGIFDVLLICAFYTLLLGSWGETRESQRALSHQRARLQNLEQNLSRQVDQLTQASGEPAAMELSRKITTLMEGLSQLKGQPTTAAKAAILDLINQTVRPLSWKIEAATPARFSLSVAGALPASTGKFLAARMLVSQSFIPELNTLVLLSFDLTYANFVFGPVGIANQLLTIGISYLGFSQAVKRLTLLSLPVWLNILAAALLAFFFGLVFPLVQLLQPNPDLPDAIGMAVHQAQVAFLVSAFASLISWRLQAIENLKVTNHRLNASVATLRQAVWSNLKGMARFVHGTVQNRLLQIYFSILDARTLDQAEIDRIMASLSPLKDSSLQVPHSENQLANPLQVIASLCESWDSARPISLEISTDATIAISQNHLAAECLVQLLQEAINNAMKHAAAGNISVAIEVDEHELSLTVTNQVESGGTSKKAGYGTQTLDYLASDWSLKLANGLAILNVLIPLGNL